MKTAESPEDPIPQPVVKPPSSPDRSLAGMNLSELRLSQNFAQHAGVKRAILTIPVRKPTRQSFVRVRPGEEWRMQVYLLNLKDESEVYLVHPSMADELLQELTPATLHLTIDRQGVLFLWHTKLPGVDGKLDEWSRSAAEAAVMAEQHWISVRSNMGLGAYEVFEATGDLPEPKWPDLTMDQLVKTAFKDRFIVTPSHPVVRRLRGEV